MSKFTQTQTVYNKIILLLKQFSLLEFASLADSSYVPNFQDHHLPTPHVITELKIPN